MTPENNDVGITMSINSDMHTLDEINTTCSMEDTQKACVTWLQNNG